MSHLPQSQTHYGCRGNAVCSNLACLMADVWVEMGNESQRKRNNKFAVDGAAKQLNE